MRPLGLGRQSSQAAGCRSTSRPPPPQEGSPLSASLAFFVATLPPPPGALRPPIGGPLNSYLTGLHFAKAEPRSLTPVPLLATLPAGVIPAEQDHGAVIGFVWIADTDRLDRLDRTRLTGWRAHCCRRNWSHNFTRRARIGRVWSPDGRPVLPVVLTFVRADGVTFCRFVVGIAPTETIHVARYTLLSITYRPRLGEEARRNKKCQRKGRR
jgi:hypothetical protein